MCAQKVLIKSEFVSMFLWAYFLLFYTNTHKIFSIRLTKQKSFTRPIQLSKWIKPLLWMCCHSHWLKKRNKLWRKVNRNNQEPSTLQLTPTLCIENGKWIMSNTLYGSFKRDSLVSFNTWSEKKPWDKSKSFIEIFICRNIEKKKPTLTSMKNEK